MTSWQKIIILYQGEKLHTTVNKFGPLVGDFLKIRANAVLSLGTILNLNTVIKRLELIEQIKE